MIKGKKRSAPTEAGSEQSVPEKIPKTKKISEKSTKTFAEKPNQFKKPRTPFTAAKGKGKGAPPKKGADDKPQEKTDWRKFKQEKKELRLKRKKTKDSYEVSLEAKQIYEKLKCRKTEDKKELVEKLYNMIKGDLLKKLVMAHDTARIIQCMLKFAAPTVREQISEELLPIAVDMSISKYAHFCILRMFKYGSPKTKQSLINSFYGSVVKLASHNVSSKILDHAYLTVATEAQKANLRQELYGDLYKKAKDASVKTLSDTYKDSTHLKTGILGSVKANLEHIANKNLVDSALVHSVLLEYLKELDGDEEKLEEIVTVFGPLVPLLLTTKDGTHAAILCFWHSTPKGRRAIIKVIKEHLGKICVHEQGHVFILAILNSMDDTKAIKKSLFDPIYAELPAIMANKWGRKVIEWFITPADTNCYHPGLIAFIEGGLKYGKKDKEVRRKEIFEQVEEPISKAIAENADVYVSDGHIGLVTAAILNKMSANNFSQAADAIAKVICKPDWKVQVQTEQKPDSEAPVEEEAALNPGIEDAGLHIAIKKILKQDTERIKNGQETFGSILTKNLSDETVTSWIESNRGCFVLLTTYQNNATTPTGDQLKELIRPHLAALKKKKNVGAKILIEKLEF